MTDDILDTIDWAGLGDDISALLIQYGLHKTGPITTQISVGDEFNAFAFVTEPDGEWWAL